MLPFVVWVGMLMAVRSLCIKNGQFHGYTFQKYTRVNILLELLIVALNFATFVL